jgi:hypothetical protein
MVAIAPILLAGERSGSSTRATAQCTSSKRPESVAACNAGDKLESPLLAGSTMGVADLLVCGRRPLAGVT